jgi:hypothetical protein
MDQDKRNELSKSLRRLADPDVTSDKILKDSLILQIPSRRRGLFLLLCSTLFFVLYYGFLIKFGNIIEGLRDILGSINDIVVPTFAVIITGYAIFQALVNGSTLINLMTASDKDKSKFEEYNLYFFGLSILYLMLIILNLLLIVFLKTVPEDWSLPLVSNSTNNLIASLLLTIYFTLLIHCLVELKSFVFNLFLCFRINATSSGIDFLREYNDIKRKNK